MGIGKDFARVTGELQRQRVGQVQEGIRKTHGEEVR